MQTKINNHTLFHQEKDLVKKADVRLLTELLYDFYDGLPFVLITIHALEALVRLAKGKQKKLEAVTEPEFVHETGVEAVSTMLDLVHLLKDLIKQNLNLIK